MALFTVSSYHDYIDLQNVSGSGDPASAPDGGIYLFASGTAGNAKLFLQNEGSGSSDAIDIANLGGAFTLAGDSGTDQEIANGNTMTIAGGEGLATVGSNTDTLTISLDIDGMSTATTTVADADLLIIDDGANGTNQKITRANLIGSALAAFDNGLTSTTVSASSTLQAVGNSFLGGQLNVSGAADLDSTLNVQSAATFQSTVDAQGVTSTTISGSGVFEAAGAARFSSTLGVTGAATFADSVDAQGVTSTTISGSGVFEAAGAARFSSTLGVTGAATFAGTGDFQGVTSTTVSASSTLQAVGNTTIGGTLNVSGAATLAGGVTSLAVSDLTQNRITFAGASGELSDSANLQFVSNNVIINGGLSGSGAGQVVGSWGVGGTLAVTGGANIGGTNVTINQAGNIQTQGKIDVLGQNSAFGADGSGVNVSFFGAASNEELKFEADNFRLVFTDSGDATHITIGGDADSEYAVDVADGSNNKNKIRAAAFVTYSDENLKTEVTSMQNTALDTIMNLEGVEFTWKNSGERDFGFIAQEVQKVVPKAVHTAHDGVQGVDYSRLTSILVEAVKSQQVQIEELKALLKK